MKINELAHPADDYVQANQEQWLLQGKYVADMDQYKIRQFQNVYSIWANKNEVIACATIKTSDIIPVIDDIWVKKSFRQQKLFSKLLWFFITKLNYSELMLGPSHSIAMQ